MNTRSHLRGKRRRLHESDAAYFCGGEEKKKSLLPHISRRTIGMCEGGKKYTSACQHH